MSLTTLTYIAADLIALAVLVGALYAPRHARKDLMAAYIGVNVGVLAVTLLLSTASVAAGLGLGLFGVLSIIRLRSTELAQHEVAYFFAALALGLLGGIQTAPIGMVAALMGTVVAALWIGDHPALMRRNRHQVIVLDHAITNETALIAHLERTLGGQVRSVEVQRLDLVNDTTTVDVRFRVPRDTSAELEAEVSGVSEISRGSDDDAPALEPAGAPAAPTVQAWTGTHLSTVQTSTDTGQADTQPVTITPAAQYVARSASQSTTQSVGQPVSARRAQTVAQPAMAGR